MANVNKAKDVKKKGRRLKRSIRKTLGTLFLVSALVVAAIPVDYLQADENSYTGERVVERPDTSKDKMKVTIVRDNPPSDEYWSKTRIPKIKGNQDFAEKIFKSADLLFRFCVSNLKSEDRYAVIVGYDTNKIEGDILTIPETLDAYDLYKGNSCAIGGDNGEFLFYKVTNTVDAGNGTITSEDKYYPCYFGEISNWISKEYDVVNNPEGKLYYIKDFNDYEQLNNYAVEHNDTSVTPISGKEWFEARGTATQRYKNIKVYYIGNEYVDLETGKLVDAGKSVNDTDAPVGVFTNVPVSSIDVKPNLIGIGDYAFAGAPIGNVSLSHTVKEIGNYAFSRCSNLRTFTIDSSATDVIIGDHAFYYCSALGRFDAHSVTKIGDSAFEECRILNEVILEGTEESGTISNIGYYAFANCGELKEIVLPHGYFEDDLRISTFWKCNKLTRIYAMENAVNFTDGEDEYYTFKSFLDDVSDEFYFEGPKGAEFESTVVDEYFTFKYEKQEVYEKKEPDPIDNSKNATFEVTRLGEGLAPEKGEGAISRVEIDSDLESLNIPGKVGLLSVVEIGQGGFSGNSNIKNVIIPAEITRIGDNAFANCRNMENVFFDNPWTLTPNRENSEAIGRDAFKTGSAQLNFISGASFKGHNNSIEEEAFKYAMKNENTINDNLTHIKYYTGWPSNLVVENQSGKATLIEYPTFAELAKGTLGSYYYKPEVAEGYKKAALSVGNEALGTGDSSEGSNEDKSAIKDAVENIVIPAGIEVVEKNLFKDREKDEKTAVDSNQANAPSKRLTVYGLNVIDDNAFEAAEYLQEVALYGNTESIGSCAFKDCVNLTKVTVAAPTRSIASYAFKDCSKLIDVTVTAPLEEMATVPFIGCDTLSNVKFGGESKFICDKSIIYKADGGVKKALVEYLNGRGGADVGSEETKGIEEICEEAFRETDVHRVYLDEAEFRKLPKGVFQNTLNLDTVILPSWCGEIGDDAFTDSAIAYLTIPNDKCVLDPIMFRDTDDDGKTNLKGIEFTCQKDSFAWSFAERYSEKDPVECNGPFRVTFYGYNKDSGERDLPIPGYEYENVQYGTSVKAPNVKEVPLWENHEFKGEWDSDEYLHVIRNLEIKAVYSGEYSVVFYDKDWETILYDASPVAPGGKVNPPTENNAEPPVPILSWRNKATGEVMTAREIRNMPINQDVEFIAEYSDTSSTPTPGPGGDQSPSPSPGTQTPAPSPTRRPGGDEPNPDGSYSLDVTGGSGSGSYLPGQQVTIKANEAPVGKRFVRWEVSPASVVILDKTKPETIITMPSSDVAVIPVYVSDLTNVPRPEGTYPCEVQNGDGSGYYTPGSQVIITADEAPAGKRFVGWNVTPSTVVVADKNSPTTSITMPEGNVTVIPVYVSEGSYSLEVQSGSGSGYHIPGSQIVITADVPPEGKRFVRWDVSPASALLSDKTSQVAILTMPSADVAIIAIYESITGDDNNRSKYNLQVVNGTGSGSYAAGSQVVITADPAPERQRFSRWGVLPANTVVLDLERESTILTMPSEDVTIMAQYEGRSGGSSGDDGEETYELKVLNGSGSGLYPEGAQVIITANAPAEKQEFVGWDVSPAETLVADKTRMSTIVTMPAGDVGVVANYNTLEPDPSPTPGPTSTPAPALHSLIVHNGSGSGSYVAGAQIVIVANDPAAGQEFTGWTVSPDNTVISDKTLSGAVITMPDNDVAVIANYRARATGSGNTGSSNTTNTNNSGNNTNNNNSNNSNNNNSNSGGSSNTNTNRPSGSTGTSTGTSNRGGTTVVIDKNGLSNTGVVSATVNGSSDNFTIKITESSEATSAVLNALLAEYGNVDNIKYFPMDISLYDSTGNTKITDTTGLSVSITLPLPDSLITYAGNNKVAGVVNDRLDKLTPRFTTINGVSCITFTAEHFSPYVIYVDVANLSSGTITDATPTTGDGIHPKWFLSIGLACMSFVMFMMKDGGKTSGKKRKVKVRV